MKYSIGQHVMVYDKRLGFCKEAEIKNIEYSVPSSFDKHIYPVLFDVMFLHDQRLSKGHLGVEVIEVKDMGDDFWAMAIIFCTGSQYNCDYLVHGKPTIQQAWEHWKETKDIHWIMVN